VNGTLRLRRLRPFLVPSLIVVALISGGCTGNDGGSRSPSSPAVDEDQPASVRELTSIDTLREAFNADAGSTRLILLISPT
jgi:hypothetical protein